MTRVQLPAILQRVRDHSLKLQQLLGIHGVQLLGRKSRRHVPLRKPCRTRRRHGFLECKRRLFKRGSGCADAAKVPWLVGWRRGLHSKGRAGTRTNHRFQSVLFGGVGQRRGLDNRTNSDLRRVDGGGLRSGLRGHMNFSTVTGCNLSLGAVQIDQVECQQVDQLWLALGATGSLRARAQPGPGGNVVRASRQRVTIRRRPTRCRLSSGGRRRHRQSANHAEPASRGATWAERHAQVIRAHEQPTTSARHANRLPLRPFLARVMRWAKTRRAFVEVHPSSWVRRLRDGRLRHRLRGLRDGGGALRQWRVASCSARVRGGLLDLRGVWNGSFNPRLLLPTLYHERLPDEVSDAARLRARRPSEELTVPVAEPLLRCSFVAPHRQVDELVLAPARPFDKLHLVAQLFMSVAARFADERHEVQANVNRAFFFTDEALAISKALL
mmetsp:Transcript_114811/g.324485  ORF Transcript_114811/g.324485 Transcript_114811/m.324485 type:complete len:441 (+) Transcript_114811:170-1492(+)